MGACYRIDTSSATAGCSRSLRSMSSMRATPMEGAMRKFTSLVRLALGICTFIAMAFGQESRATISGTITDPQGALVPGAKIAVKNLATNVVSTVDSNERGFYTVPPVNPGEYSVTVSATGFN